MINQLDLFGTSKKKPAKRSKPAPKKKAPAKRKPAAKKKAPAKKKTGRVKVSGYSVKGHSRKAPGKRRK